MACWKRWDMPYRKRQPQYLSFHDGMDIIYFSTHPWNHGWFRAFGSDSLVSPISFFASQFRELFQYCRFRLTLTFIDNIRCSWITLLNSLPSTRRLVELLYLFSCRFFSFPLFLLPFLPNHSESLNWVVDSPTFFPAPLAAARQPALTCTSHRPSPACIC